MKKVLLLCSMFVVAALAMAQTPRPAGVTEGIFYDKPNKGDVTVSFYAADKSGNVPVKIFILSSLSGGLQVMTICVTKMEGIFGTPLKGCNQAKNLHFNIMHKKLRVL